VLAEVAFGIVAACSFNFFSIADRLSIVAGDGFRPADT
jgi:hypothetical protein